jgi:predicted esterase
VISEHHLVVQRTARYFTVADPAADTTDLWIVCHGYGQLAETFIASFESIVAPGRLIVAPEGLSRFYTEPASSAGSPNRAVGATWMTREDRESEIVDHVRYLDALVDHIRATRASGSVRLRALGFSQGVATVARWVARGTVRVDELIVWAGAFPEDVDLAAFRERLAGAPVAFVAGSRDLLASWASADTHLQRFTAAGIQARLVTFDGGHRLDNATLIALAGPS